ncbi:MAG: M28 family peptidase [Spirochaetaceae bacterium]|nr:M28 family peptidase [Spirochaetaceae bacterium]
MKHSLFSNEAVPYSRFNDFINPKNRRFDVLCSVLSELRLAYNIVKINGSRHLFVRPCGSLSHNGEASSVLIAHYDCVENSPGANDNGAAVFMLIDAALKLSEKFKAQDAADSILNVSSSVLFIFTDNEELKSGASIKEQGAYSLAKALGETGMADALFFIFDCCGIGSTLIISTTADQLLKNETSAASARTKQKLRLLRRTALDTAEKTMNGSYLLMPTPFSDDIGFLYAGLTAQTITVLPQAEAMAFSSVVRNNPLYVNALINSNVKHSQEKLELPTTWKNLNGPKDTCAKLTTQNFPAIVKFATALCGL